MNTCTQQPAAELKEAALSLARQIAANAPLATSAIKRMVDKAAAGQAPEDNMREIADAQLVAITSPDFAEAMTARLEGRAPVFTGQPGPGSGCPVTAAGPQSQPTMRAVIELQQGSRNQYRGPEQARTPRD